MTYSDSFIDYRAIVDAINMPIHIIDTDAKLVYANAEWENMMNMSRDAMIGLPIDDVIGEHNKGYYFSIERDASNNSPRFEHFDKKKLQSIALTALTEKRQVSMFAYSTSNSYRVLTSTPIYQGNEVQHVVTVCQDLTDSSQFHDEVKSAVENNSLILNELNFQYNELLPPPPNIVYQSSRMLSILKDVTYVASTDATVLITGESGTGKDVLANEIYMQSKRVDKPFIRINCAAIPETLIDSELFGYEKGAFTGAIKSKPGIFELANTGTLLLDEIGELPKSLQPKLLRVLQNREIIRVGGTKTIPIDVRLIAVTNQNLEELIQKGEFRLDLFYRLNLISFHVPPLRDRGDDVPLLVDYFMTKFNAKYERNKQLTDGAINVLKKYQWPGNIRELENLLERLTIIGDEKWITSSKLERLLLGSPHSESASRHIDFTAEKTASDYLAESEDFSLKDIVSEYEKKILLEVLNKCGTTYKAAEMLKTPQPTIARKAKYYNLKW